MFRLACIALLLTSATAISAQQMTDPAAILARAKERLLADLTRMPRYTCIETVTRNTYSPPLHLLPPTSCREVVAEHDRRKHELKLSGWDRLRLDVALSNGGEIYSWVGAPRFEEGTLEQIAGKGALGSGDFGPFVSAIFAVATIKFQQEQVINGRRLLEYSYDVPEDVSKYQIFDNSRTEWFITAYSGTFLLDWDDPDLVRLTVRTADLRPGTRKCQAINEVEYRRIPIHGSQALIPQKTRLRVIGRTGEEALNLASYSNCREYSSKSVLRFDAPDLSQSGSAKASAQVSQGSFPPGLNFQWRVVTPIDSDTAAAGDAVEAILRSTIRNKNGEVLAPSGARIHGRLVYFAQVGDAFELTLEFESIEIDGATVPFNAALASDTKSGVWLHALKPGEVVPGGARFRFRADHLKLAHLGSSGRTASPDTGKKVETRPSSH